jgi:hypothetical protein
MRLDSESAQSDPMAAVYRMSFVYSVRASSCAAYLCQCIQRRWRMPLENKAFDGRVGQVRRELPLCPRTRGGRRESSVFGTHMERC